MLNQKSRDVGVCFRQDVPVSGKEVSEFELFEKDQICWYIDLLGGGLMWERI